MANETQDRSLPEAEMRVNRPSSWKTTEIWTPGPTKYRAADLGKYFSQNPPLGCNTIKPKKKSDSEKKSNPEKTPEENTVPTIDVPTIAVRKSKPKCVPVPKEPVPSNVDTDVISAPMKYFEGTVTELLEITELLTHSDSTKRIERLIESTNAGLENMRQAVLTLSKSSRWTPLQTLQSPEDFKTAENLKKSEDIKSSESLEIPKNCQLTEDLDGSQNIESANISDLLNQTYVIDVSEQTKTSERNTYAVETMKKRVPMTIPEPAKEMAHTSKLSRMLNQQRLSTSKRPGNPTLPKSPYPRKHIGPMHNNQKAEHDTTKQSDMLSGEKATDSVFKLPKKPQKCISNTLPKISPLRNVDNNNIVFPAHTLNGTRPKILNSQEIPDNILNISAVPHTTPLRGTRNHRKCKESFAHSTPNNSLRISQGRSSTKSPADHLPLLSPNSGTLGINTYCINVASINDSIITHESKSYFVDESLDQWSDPDESIKLKSPPRVVAGIRKTSRKIGPSNMENLNSLAKKHPITDLNPTNPSPATKFFDSRVPRSPSPSTEFFTSKRKSTALEKLVQSSLNESGLNGLNVSKKIDSFSELSNNDSSIKIASSKPSRNYVKFLVKEWEGNNDAPLLNNDSKPLNHSCDMFCTNSYTESEIRSLESSMSISISSSNSSDKDTGDEFIYLEKNTVIWIPVLSRQ